MDPESATFLACVAACVPASIHLTDAVNDDDLEIKRFYSLIGC